MESGVQFVMTRGMILMLEWYAHSLVTPEEVLSSIVAQFECSSSSILYCINSGSVSQRSAYFGGSSYGPVSVGNVQCTGSETRLRDCGLTQTPSSACTHSQDAGVVCMGKWLCRCTPFVSCLSSSLLDSLS